MYNGKRLLISSSTPRRGFLGSRWRRAFGKHGNTVGATLLQDNFTDTDGVLLPNHAMVVGPGWTANNGTWDIQTNRANTSGAAPGGPQWVATADAGQGNVVASLLVNTSNVANESGLIFRYSDNDNLWLAAISDVGNSFSLYDRQTGTWTQRATTTVAITTGTDYTIQVTLNGTSITALLDGGNQISFTSSFNQGATKFGLRGDSGQNGDRFDSFLVTAL